jgi:protein involved in polysaccharide export with SLBB domain
MKPGKGWSSWKKVRRRRDRTRWGLSHLVASACVAFFSCFLSAGCTYEAQQRADVEKHLMSDRDVTTRNRGVADNYQVGCPDILAIEVAGRSILKTRQMVGVDGRVDLGDHGKPRVEGRTPVQIAELIAGQVGVAPGCVKVQVAEYRSQQLFLFGQVVGWQRSVAYRGQETVADLLQRVGAITPGAGPQDVYVVRAHIAEGDRPEVFHVDLQAIVVNHDQKTNLRLLPNDQVYVGETRQARVERIIPPWFRPLYQAIWNTQPQKSEVRVREQMARLSSDQSSEVGSQRSEVREQMACLSSDL